MSYGERDNLLSEISEIRKNIERLQSEVNEHVSGRGPGNDSSRAKLTELRKDLARDMEQLHRQNSS
jgi:hypothetical protein